MGNAFLRLFLRERWQHEKNTCRKPTRIMYHVRIAKVNWSCIFRDMPNQMSFHHTIGRVNCDSAWTSLVSCVIAWSNYMWAAVTTLAEREESQKYSPCVTVQVWEWISNFCHTWRLSFSPWFKVYCKRNKSNNKHCLCAHSSVVICCSYILSSLMHYLTNWFKHLAGIR